MEDRAQRPRAAEARPAGDVSGDYLTFMLGAGMYGIPIVEVQEIVGMPPVTRIPRVPRHVLGVINLRGKIVPAVDLRRRLGMEACAATRDTCVIVVSQDGGVIGAVVDRVLDVHHVGGASVQSTPDLGAPPDNRYATGLCTVEGGVLLLLDIHRVLSPVAVMARAIDAVSETDGPLHEGEERRCGT